MDLYLTVLSVEDLACQLGRSKKTIYRMVAADRIPHVHFDRAIKFYGGEVQEWLEAHKTHAGPGPVPHRQCPRCGRNRKPSARSPAAEDSTPPSAPAQPPVEVLSGPATSPAPRPSTSPAAATAEPTNSGSTPTR